VTLSSPRLAPTGRRPPLLVPARELLGEAQGKAFEGRIREVLSGYRESLKGDRRHLFDSYRFADLARKVVGVGSVGTRAWVVLMMGRDVRDPLFLQAKEAEASVLEPYAGASEFEDHGERVVQGQWLMQAASDILLGWVPAIGLDNRRRDFYVRQLWDGKRSVEVETLPPEGLEIYGRVCGWPRSTADAAGIDGEAARLDPPPRFRIRPGALRVRIARAHPGASPSAAMPEGAWEGARTLARIAFGP
jgi:hypothetical protein